MSWTCSYCKRSLPATTEGAQKKLTIRVKPNWCTAPLTVIDGGENCYPCPSCEEKDGVRTITHWDHADMRLHKRLRQHHHRSHHVKLGEKYTPTQVVEFYDDARRLRCELIHGPDDSGIHPRETPATKTPPKEPAAVYAHSADPADPETPTRRRARNISAKESQAISLPPTYLEWLNNELRKDSVASYTGVAKTFLHWVGKRQNEPGVLADVWNLDLVRAFITDLKPQVAPTTIFNYLCAITTAQRFVRQHGEVEPTPATVYGFASLLRQASRGKSDHQKVVAETKRKTSVTLHEVKNRILENEELYKRFKGLVKLCDDGGSLSQSQFTWATGYALFNLQASNFKRNGNTLKIQFKPALKRIQSALKHKKACELVVTNATKTGGTEVFSIVKMKRLKILLMYATSLRPAAMGTGQCPQFFVNTIGKRITKASTYIAALGKSVGLPNLTIKDLRTRIETEAALRGKTVDRSAIAGHLAHTEATRDRHYLLVDKRRSREAAMDVEKLIDQAEPPEDSDADTSMDSSILSEDDIEYDDESSSEQNSPSPDESSHSTPSSGEPESDHADLTESSEGSSSDESKKAESHDLTQSPSPLPSPSNKRRQPTGLSDSESSDASLTLPTPVTKKARLDNRNSGLAPISSPEFQALLHGSPPLRTREEEDRPVTPTLSPSKEEESQLTVHGSSPLRTREEEDRSVTPTLSPTETEESLLTVSPKNRLERSPPQRPTTAETPIILADSDDTSSSGSINIFTDVTNSEGENRTKRAHTASDSSGEPASHQRPRTCSENAPIEPREESGDEGSKSDPGEASPPWTRTLRHRSYTVNK